MNLEVLPLSDAGGVEVVGIDLGAPVGDERAAALRELFDREGLLLFRNQSMSKPALVAAAARFGEPLVHLLGVNNDAEVPEIAVVSTRGRDGNVVPASEEDLVGRIDWHTDQAYTSAPNRAAMMWAVEVPPEGGMTGFIDRQKVYESLPGEIKKRIDRLGVIQSWRMAQQTIAKNPNFSSDEGKSLLNLDKFPDLVYPLVHDHPNGRKVLHAPPMWSASIVGVEPEEGGALLDDLIEFSLQPKFVHWQSYAPGDVIIWDNWRFMHAASGTKGKYRRLMYRVVLKGERAFGVPATDQ